MAQLKGKYIEDGTIAESKLDIDNSPTNGHILSYDSSSGKLKYISQAAGDSHDVRVSANDTTPGFLEGKLGGTENLITLTTNNDGANETITINVGSYVFNKNTDNTDDITEGTKKFYDDSLVATYLGTIKGQANGIAPLGVDNKISTDYLPSSVLGGVSYQGTWNATTNNPTLVSSTGTKGYYYVVSAAGSTTLDGVSDWKIGDWVVFNGVAWEKIDNTDSVTNVNGYTGAVSLKTDDIDEDASPTNLWFTTARARGAISANGGVSYNSTTGNISLTTALPVKKVEILTLSGTDIANKYIDLSQTPKDATAVEVCPVGGIPQEYTVDFTVITDGSAVKRLNWNSLGLESVLSATDKLIISYIY